MRRRWHPGDCIHSCGSMRPSTCSGASPGSTLTTRPSAVAGEMPVRPFTLTWWVTTTSAGSGGLAPRVALASEEGTESGLLARHGRGLAFEHQARGVARAAPGRMQHGLDADAALAQALAQAACLRAPLIVEVALGGAVAQAHARWVAHAGRVGVANQDDGPRAGQGGPARLVGTRGAGGERAAGPEQHEDGVAQAPAPGASVAGRRGDKACIKRWGHGVGREEGGR